jgi:hypothetical protein
MTIKPLLCAPARIFLVVACTCLLIASGEALAATLGLGQPVQEENGLWSVPVLLHADANENVASLQFRLGFEQRGFEVVDVTTGASAVDAGKEAACTALRRDGARVIVAGMNLDNIADGEVARIRLRTREDSGDGGSVALDGPVLCDPMGRDIKGSITNGKVTCNNPAEDKVAEANDGETPVADPEGEALAEPESSVDSPADNESSVSEKVITTPTTQTQASPTGTGNVPVAGADSIASSNSTTKGKSEASARSATVAAKASPRASGRVPGGPLWTLGASPIIVKDSDKQTASTRRGSHQSAGGTTATNKQQDRMGVNGTPNGMQVAGIRPAPSGRPGTATNLVVDDTAPLGSTDMKGPTRWEGFRLVLVGSVILGISLWVRRKLLRR